MNKYKVISSDGNEFEFEAQQQEIVEGYACFYSYGEMFYSFYNAISVKWEGLSDENTA